MPFMRPESASHALTARRLARTSALALRRVGSGQWCVLPALLALGLPLHWLVVGVEGNEWMIQWLHLKRLVLV